MRKFNKIIIAAFALSIFSCEDATDITQKGLLSPENAVTSVEDLQTNLIGVYVQLDNTVEIQFNGTYTDELAIGTASGGQNQEELSLILNANNGKAASIYASQYTGLAQVNDLLRVAETLEVSEDDQAEFNRITGEAYAIRAYFHLKLQTYFSTDMTDDSALGGTYFDFKPGLEEYYPRDTNATVFAGITNDLNQAETLLAGTNNRLGYFSLDAIKAMRARMAAYRGDYATAGPLAQELVAKYNPLMGTGEYLDMLDNIGDGDVIFRLNRVQNGPYDSQATGGGGSVGSLYAFIASDLDGAPFLEMSRGLYNSINSNFRKVAYLDDTSIIDPSYDTNPDYLNSDVLIINKYPGIPSKPQINNLMIFRGSEMQLILAESLASGGADLAGAAAAVQALRDARLSSTPTPAAYASEQEAFADILAERRVELAFEGHRWVDLKRLGEIANVTIDKDPRDCEITGGCTLPANSTKFTLPIPLGQIDLNGLLVQNPGY
jgi:hypothetical protein